MTVTPVTNTNPPWKQYTASAGQTVFTGPFDILDDENLLVYKRSSTEEADDATQKLVRSVDYTISGSGIGSTFSITLTTAASLGDIVTLVRETSIKRITDLLINTPLSQDDLNKALNHLILIAQEQSMVNNTLSLKYQNSDSLASSDALLPPLKDSNLWKMASDGSGIMSVKLEESSGFSTLRSELAQNSSGSEGAGLVGYYSSTLGPTTVEDQLDALGSPTFPVVQTTDIVKGASDATKLARINTDTNVPTSTAVVVSWPDSDLDLKTLNDNVTAIQGSLAGIITGCEIANNSTDSDHDIDFATGSYLDSTNTNFVNVTTALTKQIDNPWSAGDNAGGLPSSLTLSASTTYHCFQIYKSSTGDKDAGFDTSVTASNLLSDSGYNRYRRVGSIITNGSSNIQGFVQNGNYFNYKQEETIFQSSGSISSGVERTITATQGTPAGISVNGLIRMASGTGTQWYKVYPTAGSYNSSSINNHSSPAGVVQFFEVIVDSSQQFKYVIGTTTTQLTISTIGYIDYRGIYG